MGDDVVVAEVEAWAGEFAQVEALLWPRFGRREPRARAAGYVRSLMAPLERKNGWTISEATGARSPDSVQWLLTGADWDPDLLRDDLRSWVVDRLGDPEGVLVVDDTGFLKKGTKSAGVQRQYTGTAGRIENCQIGVFLAYATGSGPGAGRTLLDRELYLPKVWTEDRERCAEAKIPLGDADGEVGFATKPELAQRMLARALDAGVPAAWVTGDEAYGQVGALRRDLEDRGMSYVLAVGSNQRVHPGGRSVADGEIRIDAAAAALPAQSWTTISVGAGAKGPRVHQWARQAIRPLAGPGYWLLARRSLTDHNDIAYYLAAAPSGTPLRELARVAGARWAIEETFQTAKNEVGLDHYQVRRWSGWYRHITLAMLAHAFLTITRAATTAREKGGLEADRDRPGDDPPPSAS